MPVEVKSYMPNQEVMVKCRRGSDKLTAGESCSSLSAVKEAHSSQRHVHFQCTKCGFKWSIDTGGSVNLA